MSLSQQQDRSTLLQALTSTITLLEEDLEEASALGEAAAYEGRVDLESAMERAALEVALRTQRSLLQELEEAWVKED